MDRIKTKMQQLRDMLGCPEGASLAEICTATGWQPHSARAAISGIRKQGGMVALTATTGDSMRRYRLQGSEPGAKAEAASRISVKIQASGKTGRKGRGKSADSAEDPSTAPQPEARLTGKAGVLPRRRQAAAAVTADDDGCEPSSSVAGGAA